MYKELAKTYNPKEIEDRLYKLWEEKKYFHAEVDRSRKPFTIVIPPPNITGQLHMGHALDNTLQDILIRYRRMQGFNALWQPGTDHASIATEVKIIEQLKREGIEKADLGEGLRGHGSGRMSMADVTSQLKLGSSCDWDGSASQWMKAVLLQSTRHYKLYNDGYIYRGSWIINWCPYARPPY